MSEIEKYMICDESVFREDVNSKNWKQQETEAFLELYKKYRPLLAKYRPNLVFSLIASKLKVQKSYDKTAKECQRKFNNLMRTYRKTKEKPNRASQKFMFFDQMQSLVENGNGDVESVPDPDIVTDIEIFEKNSTDKNKTDIQLIENITDDTWTDDEIKCLVGFYGSKKTEYLDINTDWFDILINLQNNGFCENKSDLNIRQKFHSLLKRYIWALDNNVPEKFPYFDDFQLIIKNRDELNTYLSFFEEDQDFIEIDLKTAGAGDDKVMWDTSDTMKLLDFIASSPSTILDSGQSTKHLFKWSHISTKLNEIGVMKNPAECVRKWSNLMRTYRKCLPKYLETNILPSKFPFFMDVHNISIKLPDLTSRKENDQWDPVETTTLIKMYRHFFKEHQGNELWQLISNNLSEKYISKSPTECERKLKQLLMEYKTSNKSLSPKLSRNLTEIKEIVENGEFVETFISFSQHKEMQNLDLQDVMDNSEIFVNEESMVNSWWTDFEVTHLLNLCKNYGEMYDPDTANRMKWTLITKLLRELNIEKTPEECARKWSNLTRTYRICLRKKFSDNNIAIKFKYYDLMYKLFGDSLILDFNTKKKFAQNLNAQKTVDLINLKYHYSKQNKSYSLTNEQWEEIAKSLEIDMKASSLRVFYLNLFKKYQAFKDTETSTDWPFYEIFDKLYSRKTESTETSQLDEIPSIIEYISSPTNQFEIYDQSEEIIEEETECALPNYLQFVATHFMEICKFCLKIQPELKQLGDDQDLVNKVNELFYEFSDEKLNTEISDSICADCQSKIEISHEFRNQFKESSNLLKQFSEEFEISKNVIEEEPISSHIQEKQEEEMQYSDIIITNEDEIEIDQIESETIFEVTENIDEDLYEKVTDTKDEGQFFSKKVVKELKTCDICGKEVKNMKTHMETHSKTFPYSCAVCKKKFSYKYRLKRHIKTHLGIRDYECYCGKKFICSTTLAKHKLSHEKNMKFTCEVCNRKFYRQSIFKRHQSTHGLGLKYFCSVCNKGFLWEGSLKEHENIHLNIRAFKCTSCEKSFFSKKCLRIHVRSRHMQLEKQHKCEMCDTSFLYPAQLKSHMLSKHCINVDATNQEQTFKIFDEDNATEIVLAADFIDYQEPSTTIITDIY